jgi:hypothetical protein
VGGGYGAGGCDQILGLYQHISIDNGSPIYYTYQSAHSNRVLLGATWELILDSLFLPSWNCPCHFVDADAIAQFHQYRQGTTEIVRVASCAREVLATL